MPSSSDQKPYVRSGSKRLIGLLSIVIAVGVTLSLFSYAYFLSVSDQINETVRADLGRQARAEAFHLDKILENNIAIVVGHALTAANSPLITSGDIEKGSIIINDRQAITGDVTDRYFWLDKQGKTVWSSAFTNTTERELYQGFDVSDRPYFTNPLQTGQPYFSPVVQSPVDKSQRVFFSYPILSGDDTGPRSFEGVIVASIRADTLGDTIKSQTSKELESSIGLIDPNGVLVYTSNATLVGENLFGEKIQSLLKPAFASKADVAEFNDFMTASLSGSGDSRDFSTVNGATSTVTYLPIVVNADAGINTNQTTGYHFLTLYVTAPHNFAATVNPLIEQVRNFSLGVIAAVSAVTVVVAIIVLIWNRRLEQIVEERTASLKEANEQLKVHDKMQAEFINIAAHELRTPVQPIKGVAEMARLMAQEKHGSKAIDGKVELDIEEVDMLYRNASRLEKLTENILDVTRIESQSLRLKKERFDLVEKIKAVVYDYQRHNGGRKEDRKAIITYEEPGEPIMIEADLIRIFEVLSNLIGNSMKFTKSGSITIKSTIEQPDKVVVSIRDTGTGIDESIVPRLFTKFATGSESGTGLGLFISKNIIEAHGGTMWAGNNADGSGATFFFSLPYLKDPQVPPRTEVANAQVIERERIEQ
ncbi:MAG TPA: ATP-binding protein [Nitrososphaera sp.]|nr:ATP-binding protein [Nitrososphaera sp.]